jgi:hypothetical protein
MTMLAFEPHQKFGERCVTVTTNQQPDGVASAPTVAVVATKFEKAIGPVGETLVFQETRRVHKPLVGRWKVPPSC